jgi:hypothetical protein
MDLFFGEAHLLCEWAGYWEKVVHPDFISGKSALI